MHATLSSELAHTIDAPAPNGGNTRITAPTVVDARWLRSHHDAIRIIDTRPAVVHASGHVPGSISLPLDALRLEDTSRPALEQIAAQMRTALADRGIAPVDHIVLVDDADGSASLGATICELAGGRHVSVVHGSGVNAWRALGEPLSMNPARLDASSSDAWREISSRSGIVAAFEDLVDAVVEGTHVIVDVRSQLEHEGIVGAPCCGSRGAIPGSVHLEWTAFFDMADQPRGSEQVREIASHVGLERDTPIMLTCHAGHRAAIAARVLRSAGFRDVRVSIGSWHEWSLRGLGVDADAADT